MLVFAVKEELLHRPGMEQDQSCWYIVTLTQVLALQPQTVVSAGNVDCDDGRSHIIPVCGASCCRSISAARARAQQQTRRKSIDRTAQTDGRTDTRPLREPCTACYAGSVNMNKDTSLRNFVPNSGLRKFRHGTSIVAVCCQPRSTKAGR